MTVLTAAVTVVAVVTPDIAHAQAADYYRSPVDIPVYLSANYAEIRTNRFHTGIDIKTQGVTGKPLFATADGYISRVTVAPGGYGRAIYITHHNGTMTVYAHMERFRRDIEEWLRTERYHQKRSDIDAFPPASLFPVEKGETIGLAGNSGSSTGPHLHYEVRRSADSRTLNIRSHDWMPVEAGDDVPPRIVRLYHIDVDTVERVPVHSRPRAYDVKLDDDGNYSLVRTQPLKAGPASYFVIEATDRMTGVTNTFGIYRARMSVDGAETLVFEKDELLFEDVRYACASVLYDIQRKSRNEAVMLAVKNGNRLPMYKKAVGRGVVTLGPGERRDIGITIEDDALNTVSLSFAIERDDARTTPARPEGRIASDRRDFIVSENGLTVIIPQGALYEPIFYTQQVVEKTVAARPDSIRPLSPIHRTGNGYTPLHRAMKIAVAADIPENLRPRACLAKVSDDGKLAYAGGSWTNGVVSGSTRDFGTFCAVADTIPPTAGASFKNGSDLSKTSAVTLTATDNFSGVSNFSGTIDGDWIIFERSASRGQFFHRFDPERLETGRTHTLEFTIRDGAGNTTVRRWNFYK